MAYQYHGHDWDVTGKEPGGSARILAAAIDLYGRHGFDHVTLKDIAAAAGVSPPLVIHHFGSSAGLRDACDRHVADSVNRTKKDSVRRGHLPTNLVLEMMRERRHLLLYVFRAFAAGGEATDHLFDQMVEDAMAYIAEAEELGLAHPSADPHRRTVILLAQSFGALLLHRQIKRHLGIDPVDGQPEDLAPYMSALMEQYTQPLLNADVYANLVAMGAQPEQSDHDTHQHPDTRSEGPSS